MRLRGSATTGIFSWFGKDRGQWLTFICSDMWKPSLKVNASKGGQVIDELRAEEVKALNDKGLESVLTKTRWLLLKRDQRGFQYQGKTDYQKSVRIQNLPSR